MNPSKQAVVRSLHDERAFRGFEMLEGRMMMSTGPTIGALTVDQATVARGTDVVVNASNVTYTPATGTASVGRVGFYFDTNHNGSIDATDKFLGQGTKQINGTTYKLTFRTRFAPVGADTILARAVGTDKSVGATVSTVVNVTDAPPVVSGIVVSKKSVAAGAHITLVALAHDIDGKVNKVDFYIDSNNDGIAQDSEKLGTSGSGGFISTVIPSSLVPSSGNTLTFLAKATDAAGSVSALASKTVPLEQAPTVASLTSSSDNVAKPANFTLTASGVVDADGSVSRVAFWLDRNKDGKIGLGDLLVGLGSQANGDPTTWALTLSSKKFAKGSQQFLVKAVDNNNNGNNESLNTVSVAIS